MADVEDRIQKVEWTLYGLSGGNGLVGEVRGLRDELHGWREEERQRREEEAKAERERQEAARQEKKRDRRWLAGYTLSIIAAIIAAAGILQ